MENVDVDVECPPSSENSACPCYKFDDGKLNLIDFQEYLDNYMRNSKISQLGIKSNCVMWARNASIKLTFLF